MTFGFLFAVPCAKAQTTLSMADTNFILAAAQGGMAEVKLGDLKALAAQKGVTLPNSLDAKHQAMVDNLTALTGPGFDDAYINDMIKAHQKDAKAFKAEAAATRDADIKSFLDKSIPVVEAHLQHVTAMKK